MKPARGVVLGLGAFLLLAPVFAARANGPDFATRVLSRDELLASGARDLMDVLLREPSFSLGVDVQGVVGVGMRGLWGHEGRVALFLDGIEQNDLLYGTLQLGHHLPLDEVDRIEITEGPGAVDEGGDSELAVVRVFTRPSSHPGLSVAGTYGELPRTLGERDLSLAYGQEWQGDLGASVQGFFGQGERSDQTYRDVTGQSLSLARPNAELDDARLNLSAHVKRLALRVLADRYQTTEADGSVFLHAPVALSFQSLGARLTDALALSEGLELRPSLEYRRERPWRVASSAVDEHMEKTVDRMLARLEVVGEPRAGLRARAGVETFFDRVVLDSPKLIAAQTLERGGSVARYRSEAAWADAEGSTAAGTFGAGVRYDFQSATGAGWSGELRWGKPVGPVALHARVSTGSRAPTVEELNATVFHLARERSVAGQLGVDGYAGPSVRWSTALFGTRLLNPLLYSFDARRDVEGYDNASPSGSVGGQAGAAWSPQAGTSLALRYVYTTPAGHPSAPVFAVPGHPTDALGFSHHRLALEARSRYGRHLELGLTGSFTGARWAVQTLDARGDPIAGQLGAVLLADFTLRYRDAGVRGLDVTLGVQNLLNASLLFAQPYDGGHAPLPGKSREVFLRLAYARPVF